MNVILGYAQLMEEELKEKELPETKEHLEKLQQSGKLLLSIINNVLDMARIESGKMELDESYGRIEDFRQSVFAVFDAEAKKKKIAFQELLCRGWFLPPNTYDCGSFVVNGTAVVGKEPQKAL